MKIEGAADLELSKGRTHQEIFNEIVTHTDLNIHKVAETLRKIPSLKMRRTYNALNMVLAAGMALSALTKFVFALTIQEPMLAFVFPVINIVLLWGIIKYKSNVHLIVAGIASLSAFRAVFIIFTGDLAGGFIDFVFAGAIAALAFYLNSKLVNDYVLNRELLASDPDARVNSIIFRD